MDFKYLFYEDLDKCEPSPEKRGFYKDKFRKCVCCNKEMEKYSQLVINLSDSTFRISNNYNEEIKFDYRFKELFKDFKSNEELIQERERLYRKHKDLLVDYEGNEFEDFLIKLRNKLVIDIFLCGECMIKLQNEYNLFKLINRNNISLYLKNIEEECKKEKKCMECEKIFINDNLTYNKDNFDNYYFTQHLENSLKIDLGIELKELEKNGFGDNFTDIYLCIYDKLFKEKIYLHVIINEKDIFFLYKIFYKLEEELNGVFLYENEIYEYFIINLCKECFNLKKKESYHVNFY